MNKFILVTFLSVIGLIAAVIIIVVISETRLSSPTHVDGRYIPAKTQAGSNICNEGIDVDLLCIEFLIYEGIDDDAKKLMASGIEAIASRYTFTEPELTVDWAGFGSEGGLNNYLGVVVWHRSLSNKDDVINDLCQFIGVSKEYRDGCIDGVEGLVLSDHLENDNIAGSYFPVDDADNGHLIVLNETTFNANPRSLAGVEIKLQSNDPRTTAAHEYFHFYQRVHTLNMLKASDNEFPTEGPYWLIEGAAEYGSYKTASDEGWFDWDYEVWLALEEVKVVMEMYPDISLTDSITFSDYKRTRMHEYSGVVLWKLGFLASAYAISLSSHDALMVDYYDDLEEYGAEKSFERNIGITFDEFHKSFADLIQKDTLEIIAVINRDSTFEPNTFYEQAYKSQQMFRLGEVEFTKIPAITNKILSFSAKIPDGLEIAELWIYYNDVPRSSNLVEVSDRIDGCLAEVIASYYDPECGISEQVAVVIPKPEKDNIHGMPALRYDMLFTITDMWTIIDDTLHVQVDISDSMVGSGVYTVALMSGLGELSMIESLEYKQILDEIWSKNLDEESATEQITDFMLTYPITITARDLYSIWVD